MWRVPFIILLLAALTGCAASFDPYNVVGEPRVLAIRAEPPTVAPGGSTTLDALVHAPGLDPSYRWSWCPLRDGTTGGYECAISESALADAAARAGVALDGLSYDLGDGDTATFAYPARPELFAALCADIGPSLPAYGSPPDCGNGFPVSIGLTVEAGGVEIRAFKEVRLALGSDTPVNHNPVVDGLAFGPKPTPAATALRVEGADVPVLEAGETYELYADVPESSAETFLRTFSATGEPPYETRENLTLSWFVQAGTTRSMRTSFADGELGFDELTHNEWKLPRADELETDDSTVYLVLHDERGGVAWTSRRFALARP